MNLEDRILHWWSTLTVDIVTVEPPWSWGLKPLSNSETGSTGGEKPKDYKQRALELVKKTWPQVLKDFFFLIILSLPP